MYNIGKHTPERHADTRDGVQHGEAADGLSPARLPQSYLTLTHPREAGGGEAVVLAHPDGAAVLCATVAGGLVDGLLLSDIPHPDLLIARGGDEHAAAGVP